MLNQIYNFISSFFRKTRTIENEPLNKVSLIVIILIDIFILINVFSGLEDISRWHISPVEANPCYSEWRNYREKGNSNKDYEIISNTILSSRYNSASFKQEYQNNTKNRLGEVSETCLDYARLKDDIKNDSSKKIINSIDNNLEAIEKLEQVNQKTRAEYDSSLLEEIARQPREDSINSVSAKKAKQELSQNQSQIDALKINIANLKQELLSKPESQKLIALLNNSKQFDLVKERYNKAFFWYPSIQLGFQSLFLFPLILITSLAHQIAQRKRYGLVSLISWHLLVIFSIPLIIKLFEFLHINVIFTAISDFLKLVFLNLLFLVHYAYILLVPAIGFGIIKLFQKIVFNTEVQAAKRVQKSRCLKCAKKIRQADSYCPHCGYYQYVECDRCHEFTYKHLPHCNQCGHHQNS